MSKHGSRSVQSAAAGARATPRFIFVLLAAVLVSLQPQVVILAAGALLLYFFLKLDRLH